MIYTNSYKPYTGEKFSEAILNSLESHYRKLDNYRGQSHKNAGNISGGYPGLLTKLVDRNILIFLTECSAQMLKLVSSWAV